MIVRLVTPRPEHEPLRGIRFPPCRQFLGQAVLEKPKSLRAIKNRLSRGEVHADQLSWADRWLAQPPLGPSQGAGKSILAITAVCLLESE